MGYVYFPSCFILPASEGVSGRITEREADFLMMDYGIKDFLEWVSGKGFFL